jgi:hypothetical protein
MKLFPLRKLIVPLLAILAILALNPTTGLAQLIDNPNFDAAPAEQTTYLSDDPLGREPMPAPIDQTVSNLELLSVSEGSNAPQSDNPNAPTGVIPPEISTSNLDAASTPDEGQVIGPEAVAASYIPFIIPVSDFTADGLNPNSSFFSFAGGYQTGNNENYGCIMAPVYLPNHATIQQFFVTVMDNDATYNVTVDLRRIQVYSGTTDILATIQTSGESTSLQSLGDTTIGNPIVIYPDYAYYVTTCLSSSNTKLYSVRIWYD